MAFPVSPSEPTAPAGLDGTWRTDPEALVAAADDFGHVVHRPPRAALRPSSIDDVVAAYRDAASTGDPIVARGAGHSTSGAGQVTGGITIDMTGLDHVDTPADDTVNVEAGARWSAVLDATLPAGLTPPTLTDYLETTVGGTLAVGGIGGGAHLYGPQVDNVVELEVITTDGERLICSPDQHRDVFDAALAGDGRTIMVRASLTLVPAPPTVRLYRLLYDDPHLFVRDQLALNGDQRWCHLAGQALSLDGATWHYMIEAADATADKPADIGALGFERGSEEITEITYRDLAHRMEPGVLELITTGDWYRAHPWFSAFIPTSRIHEFLAETMPTVRPADVGPLPILIYPLRRGRRPAPGLSTPSEATFFNVSILRTCSTPDASALAVADNDRLLRVAEEHGGTWYPVGVLPADIRST